MEPLKLPEPAAWANSSNLTSARLGRKRYGSAASELHTWREGGPTDYHDTGLYTADQVLAALAAHCGIDCAPEDVAGRVREMRSALLQKVLHRGTCDYFDAGAVCTCGAMDRALSLANGK